MREGLLPTVYNLLAEPTLHSISIPFLFFVMGGETL
jgi:hypothetical protein